MSELNEIKDEELVELETIKGVIGERVSGACTYSYRIVWLVEYPQAEAEKKLGLLGAEGYRVVEVLGPDRNTLLLEKVNGGYGW